MRTGALGVALAPVTSALVTMTLLTLAVTARADDGRATRSSWDMRPATTAPASAPDTTITWAREASPRGLAGGAASRGGRGAGPLPIDRRPPLDARDAFPPGAPAARDFKQPAVVPGAEAAPAMCPSYGNDAAAILEARLFQRESARIAGSYQLSDSGITVSFWRHTPLVVLGLQGRPVYCVAERESGQFRVPAGRRVCFADTDGDLLFNRVFIVQTEPRSYDTAPVAYSLNPVEAVRRPPSTCYISG